jgi:hypothetical protein
LWLKAENIYDKAKMCRFDRKKRQLPFIKLEKKEKNIKLEKVSDLQKMRLGRKLMSWSFFGAAKNR